MEEDIGKYFVAIIPPEPIYQQAAELKNYFKDRYHSKGALHSPPHITLHMPFQWKRKKEAGLVEKLETFVSGQRSHTVVLKDFGCFAPRVIFMNVMPNDVLPRLQKDLQWFCRTELGLLNSLYKDLPFHPHLTLAFRDLKKPAFAEAWKEFEHKEYTAQFVADRIALLRHTGKVWGVLESFRMA